MKDSNSVYDYKFVDFSDIRLFPQNKYMVITKKNDEPFLIKGPQCVLSKKYTLHSNSRFRVPITFNMRNPNFLDMLKRIEYTLASLIIQDPSHYFSENEKIEDFDNIVRESFIDFYKINTSKRSIILHVLCNNDMNAIVDPDDALSAQTDSGDAVPLELIDDTTIFYPILHLAGISIKREEQLHIQFSLSKIIVKNASQLQVIQKPISESHEVLSESNTYLEPDISTQQSLSTVKHALNEPQTVNTDEDKEKDENKHLDSDNNQDKDLDEDKEKDCDKNEDKEKDEKKHLNGEVDYEEVDLNYEEVDLINGIGQDESNIEHATFSVKQPEHLYHRQVTNFKRLISYKRHDYMKEWLRKNNIFGANVLLDEEEFDYDSDEDSYTST